MKKKDHTGILLVNLGSPDSTSVRDVRRYLHEFLMDERVIDLPWLSRTLLVKGIIVPFRAKKSANAYSTIWTEKGSPLVETARQLQAAIQQRLPQHVEIAMRYGNPGAKEAFDKILANQPGTKEVIVLPLYPQYAMSSFETAVENLKETHRIGNYAFSLRFIDPYFDEEGYIHALAESVRPYLDRKYDHMLFSYHGVPGRHIRKSDITGSHCLQSPGCCSTPSPAHKFCYRHQCFRTTELLTRKLKIPSEKFSISFQSRLGKGWLEPFTDIRLKEFPAEGIKKLLVICPAFTADCLETLEEIAIRGREIFLEAGGTEYEMIPCLNVHPAWVDAAIHLISMAISTGKATEPV